MMRALIALAVVALLLALVFAAIGSDNHDTTPPGQPAAVNPL